MYMTVEYNGTIYKSKESKGVTKKEASESFYEIADKMSKFKLDLDDGSCILFGKDACQKCIFRFYE